MARDVTKVDWSSSDALPAADLNRIEGNIQAAFDHMDTTTIHQTIAAARTDTGPFVLPSATSDPAAPDNGQIWLRTDL